MSRPLLSVVIPSYNRGYIVGDAIASALAQREHADVEVLLADDGSTDATEAVAKQFGGAVTYLYQRHAGAAAARNLAVRAAQSDFISFLDSDDVWLPGKVKAELEIFERLAEADAVVSDASSWLEDQAVHPSWLAAKQFPIESEERLLQAGETGLWIGGSRFATCSTILRRRCLALIGRPDLYDEAIVGYEDWESEIRLMRYCKIAVVPRVLAKIRRYADGTRTRMPGDPPSPEQHRQNLRCEIAILEKSVALGWPEDIEREARAKCARLQGSLA